MQVERRMNAIKQWLNAHSITSQSVAAAWVGATFLYNTNPDFKAYLQQLYGDIPHGLHSFVVGFVVPVAIFWRSTHTTKVTAEIEDGSPGVAQAAAASTSAPKG
jgi:hypothetical protein